MTSAPPLSPLAQAFTKGPGWFPQQMDAATDRVLLVRMTEENYRDASFLDQRMLTQQSQPQWADWTELEAAGQAELRDADFIFHIGHVGSTLISRLLGELDGVFALREPQILRNFADLAADRDVPHAVWSPAQFDDRLETAIGWLSRNFAPQDRALIKASSFVSAIARPMLGEERKALLLSVSPQRYIETILAGDNSRQELAMLAPSRLRRLHQRLGAEDWRLWELDEPVRVAMSWLCEILALEDARNTAPVDHTLSVDFDAFLASPGDTLAAIAGFFGYAHDAGQIEALVTSPLMTRYSKAPDHDYSADVRAKLLAEARSANQDGINTALTWLNDTASRYPMVAEALENHSGT